MTGEEGGKPEATRTAETDRVLPTGAVGTAGTGLFDFDRELPKERAIGTLELARAFIIAGFNLSPIELPGIVRPPNFPAYFLVCHGIELTLKSVLFAHGTSEGNLRRIGHDLVKALESARAVPESGVDAIPPADLDVINAAAGYYGGKEFEYVIPGAKQLPRLADLADAARRLVERVEPNVDCLVRVEIARSKTQASAT
jgi:hypothetical protein